MNKKNGGNAVRQILDFTLRKVQLEKLFRELKLGDKAVDIKIGTEVSNKEGKKTKLNVQVSFTIAAIILVFYYLMFF